MTRSRLLSALGLALAMAVPVRAEAPPGAPASIAAVTREVNKKMVKLFGSGGFRGLVSYGTGILVSPDGYILTVSSHLIDTQDLRVHLYDGRRVRAKVVVAEPELDAALVKIEDKVEDLDYFDLARAAQQPSAQPGDAVLGFSNQFQIATRDEPMSVQHGTVACYTKLRAQRGVHDAPYTGDVYILDAITNNPGAAGGAVTTRKGQLLGIIGKELQNTLTDTWINYAVPVGAKIEVRDGDKVTTVDLAKFVQDGIKGIYKPRPKEKVPGKGGYTGIVFLPNNLERTPPYVDEVLPDSPAAKAGLKPDDLIIYLDGEQVASITTYYSIMAKIRPGTTITLEVRRTDREQKTDRLVSVKLTVGEPLKKK
jgi:serine protease Do